MKKNLFFIFILLIAMIFTNPVNAYAAENNSSLSSNVTGINVSVDGYFDDWNDKPFSYEYSWDNSENCWDKGVYIDGECYKTPVGTYSTDVRHKIQVYVSKENISTHITFSKDYQSLFNGEDYNFTFNVNGNEENTKFEITTLDGEVITDRVKELFTPGIHEVLVKHGDTRYSDTPVYGSSAYIYIPEDYRNIQLEFQIPYDQFICQNSNINIDNISSIDFCTPNLMYRTITTEGAPTGTIYVIMLVILLSFLYFVRRKKNEKIL